MSLIKRGGNLIGRRGGVKDKEGKKLDLTPRAVVRGQLSDLED